MQISYNWLSTYIHLSEPPEQVADMLVALGLEVEHMQPFESIKGSLQGLIIGETLTCVKHPGADRLSLTTVDIGTDKPLQIICGAPNIAAGQKIVLATPGTTLYPVQGAPFTIKKTKIRGEHSEGMICSEAEIGLSNVQDKIIVLNSTAVPNGSPATAVFPVENDFIFEIALTPNRGDATSHIGVARDLRALTKRPVRWPSIDNFAIDNRTLHIPVTVQAPKACPRYTALTLSGISVKESPGWLQNRLRSIGVLPINNIVDITNYVCHEIGQPLHALDVDRITGNKVIVKTMPEGSPFTTLDGKVRTLKAEDLIICDAKEGMCIAGVFGGIAHGITPHTKSVFLESAYFSPECIRKTSSHHQIATDASFRFERGGNPAIAVYALKRAAMLIKELAGGTISSDIIDIYPHEIADKSILMKDKNVDRLIGISIAREKIFDILHTLDIHVTEKDDTSYTVSVPPYRVGIDREADIIEEILRIYGFDRIPLKEHAGANYLAHFPNKDISQYKKSLGEMLSANGFYEIITNSISQRAYSEKYNPLQTGSPIHIINTSNPEQNTLRQTLLFTGLEVCAYNINHKQKNLKLFEWGKKYWKDNGNYIEKECLALYMSGNATSENWQQKTRAVNYFDLAMQVAAIVEKCGLTEHIEQTDSGDNPLFEYSSKWLTETSVLAEAGKVSTHIASDLGIEQEMFFASFDQAALLQKVGQTPAITEIAKYPEVRRDLSLLLDNTIPFREVELLAREAAQKYLRELIVFDVYEGTRLPPNKKAYGIGFVFQDTSKTLQEREITKTMNKLIQTFEKNIGAEIRKC